MIAVMCGKFTTRLSWTGLVDFAWTPAAGGDPSLTLRVMNDVSVILLDIVTVRRRVVPMRWGFPHPTDWRRPQPIHARAETIDTTKAFAQAFRDGQRGIVLMETFNEAPDVEGPTFSTPSPRARSACLPRPSSGGASKFPASQCRCLPASWRRSRPNS